MATIARRATDLAVRTFTRTVRVRSTDLLGSRFHLLELDGDPLVGVTVKPGDKVQVHVGGLGARTYTPITVEDGVMILLAFAHGQGPGSALVERLRAGDELHLFGPRSSLDLTKLERAPIVVGDETSFALALAHQRVAGSSAAAGAAVAHLFEAADVEECRALLAQVGIAGALLHTSTEGGSPELVESVVDVVRATPDAPLVLTGRAQSIAAIRKRLKEEGLRPPQTLAKAYWDEHRSGLD